MAVTYSSTLKNDRLQAVLNISAIQVPADGTVAVQLTASISVAAGTSPITWLITALR